jgi:hypothetical protein
MARHFERGAAKVSCADGGSGAGVAARLQRAGRDRLVSTRETSAEMSLGGQTKSLLYAVRLRGGLGWRLSMDRGNTG